MRFHDRRSGIFIADSGEDLLCVTAADRDRGAEGNVRALIKER